MKYTCTPVPEPKFDARMRENVMLPQLSDPVMKAFFPNHYPNARVNELEERVETLEDPNELEEGTPEESDFFLFFKEAWKKLSFTNLLTFLRGYFNYFVGFENLTDSELEMVVRLPSTYNFRIKPTGESYNFWAGGKKFNKDSSITSSALPSLSVKYYIYFDTNGNLQSSTTEEEAGGDNALIATFIRDSFGYTLTDCRTLIRNDHSALINRDKEASHPKSAIEGLTNSDTPYFVDVETSGGNVDVRFGVVNSRLSNLTNGTITRDGNGNIATITTFGITTTFNRDKDGIITGWENDTHEWTLTRDESGNITGWTFTEKSE